MTAKGHQKVARVAVERGLWSVLYTTLRFKTKDGKPVDVIGSEPPGEDWEFRREHVLVDTKGDVIIVQVWYKKMV